MYCFYYSELIRLFALESDVSYTLTQEQINTEFEGLSDNQTVVVLPDGEIIFSVN